MRKMMLFLAVFASTGTLFAQSPFDGTWKVDLSKAQFPEKPVVLILQNGTFQCSTCDPKINVKADGTDQSVQGSKEYDTVAVKVVDANKVESTAKKRGKLVSSIKTTISADGKLSTLEEIDYPENSKQPVTAKVTYIRVAAGPAGSHAISGSWRVQKANQSENALTMTFKSSPGGLIMSNPVGESFDAKFDGKDYPVKGAPAGYTVSLKKVDDRTIASTTKMDGKIVQESTVSVSADGKTLTMKNQNKVQGTTSTFTATKQ